MVLTFAGPDEMKLSGNDRGFDLRFGECSGHNYFESIRDACLGQRRRSKQTDWLGTRGTEMSMKSISI